MIYSTRSHRSEFINPVPLSCSSGLTIVCLNFLNDHDGEVLHTICRRKVKVCRDWFLCPLASDVKSEAIEIFVQGILCLAHVMH